MGNVIGDVIVIVGADASDFAKSLIKETEPGAKSAGKAITSTLGEALTSSGGKIGKNLADTIGSGLASGLTVGKPLQDATEKVMRLDSVSGAAAKSVKESMETISKSSTEMGQDVEKSVGRVFTTLADSKLTGSFGKMQEGFDLLDTRAMGFRDTITGVQDSMTGVQALFGQGEAASKTLGDKLFLLGTGIGDLASGFANFLIPMFAVIQATNLLTAAGAKAALTSIAQGAANGVATAATAAWTAAQWALNAALTAVTSPIGIVVIAVAALIAGIVLLWKNNETFRDIVLAVWDAIKNAISAVASWVTGTLVPALQGAWDTVAGAAEALWQRISGAWTAVQDAAAVLWQVVTDVWTQISDGATALLGVLQSVWDTVLGVLQAVGSWITDTFGPLFLTLQATIEFAFKAVEIIALAVWKLVILPLFDLVKAGINALGVVFTWLYENAVKPAFNFIVTIIQTDWALIKAIWDLIVAALGWLGDKFTWLYNNAVKPAWDFIVTVIKGNWAVIQALWEAVKSAIGVLGDAFTALYNNYIKPAWNFISDLIKTGWNSVISPAFDAFKAGLGLLQTAFEKVKDGIKVAWDKLQDIAKAPIKFVIETVLNGGLIKGFNWLSEKIGGPHIDPIPLPFATGGVLPGYTPGRDVHTFWSPTAGTLQLSGGEAIMRPEFTRAVGGPQAIKTLNAQARAGQLRGPGNFAEGGVIGALHSYDLGGVVDWIKSQASGALSWVEDKTSAIWQALSNPGSYLKNLMPSVPGVGVITEYATATGQKLLTSAISKVTALFTEFNKAYDSIGGPIFAKIKAWVMDHLGIPYLWGGNGPQFDCSSFVQHALAAAGISIPRTSETQQAALRAVGTPKPGDLGFIGRPAHHVELFMGDGLWAEAPHTGDVTKIISQSLGSFTSFGAAFKNGGVLGRPLLMDSGGVLPRGLSLVQNNTGGPEELRPPGSSGPLYVTIELSIDDLAKLSKLDDFLAMLENARVLARRTQRSGKVTV